MTAPLHPGADPACAVCGGLGHRVVRDGPWLGVARCTCCADPCPACGGAGWVRSPAGRGVVPCACRVAQARVERVASAQLPARYAHATLDAYDPARGDLAALTVCRRYVEAFQPGQTSRGLVLWGGIGRGKTHLVVAVARELVVRHGASVRFVEFSHLLADLKGSFERPGGSHDLLDPLTACDVLVIDEIGKGRNTEFEGTVLDELVSRRYNAATVILGTTNFDPKGVATGLRAANAAQPELAPNLVDRVGERVFSRLREMCDFVPVAGEDQRAVEVHRARARRS